MSSFQINAIELKNIKSYCDERIEFGEGITIISGENGAGKSTIFEAVGHCLFGVPPAKFIGKAERFLREGERQGTIIVEFRIRENNEKDGNKTDEIQYRLVKNIKGETVLEKKNKSGTWDFPIQDGISQKIKKLLNLTGATSLDQMFTDIIGPFQSDFITPFLISGVKRKDHFDQILGISGWKELNEKTSFLDNRFKDKISNLEFETATMEKTVEPLPVKEEKLKDDQRKKKELESSLNVLNEKIGELGKKIEEMTEIRTSLDGKKTMETKIAGEREGDKKLLESESKSLEKARESLAVVIGAKPGYVVHIESQKTKKHLEIKLREKTKLFKDKAEKEKSIEGTEQNIISSRKHFNDDKAKREEESIGNETLLKQTESELADSLTEVDESRNHLEYIRGELEKVQSVDIGIISRKVDSVTSLLNRISSLEKSILNRKETLKEKETLHKESEKLIELEAVLGRINDGISTAKAKITQYKKGKEGLSQGLCPYMGEKCLNLRDWDSNEFFSKKIEELNKEIKGLEVERKEQETLKKAALTAGQKLAGLVKEEKELQKELQDMERIGSEIRNSITKNELLDIFRQMEVFTISMRDEEVKGALIVLAKQIEEFSCPDELLKYPSALNSAFHYFEECHKSIIACTKKHETQAAAILEKKVQVRSSLETQVKKLKSDGTKLSKELKIIVESLGDLDKREKQLEEERKTLSSIKTKLESFEGLEEDIGQVDVKLTESRKDHDNYMNHLKDSMQVDELLKSTEELKKNIETREKSLMQLKEEIAKLSEKFRQEELDNSRSDFSNMKEKLGEDRSELQNTVKEMKSLGEEIAMMKEVLKKIKEKRAEIVEYRKSQEFTNFLRKNIIGKIAEESAKDYRREISAIAAGIYRDISGNKNLEELIFGDGYSIILQDRIEGKNGEKIDRERIDRQLSGGQFMTAVIAIRMALLQTIGSTIAFFDEPTGNLDEDHRRNLADVFRKLDQKTESLWYNQLFLVSHDESFEGITRHHIRIRLDKKDGSVMDSTILPEMKHQKVSVVDP